MEMFLRGNGIRQVLPRMRSGKAYGERRVEMFLRGDGVRQILSGVRRGKTCESGRMELLLRSSEQRKVLPELWGEETGGGTSLSM